MDDEFGIGELLREALAGVGHAVVLAVNGRQGLDLLASDRPDLLILDYLMPVLNGAGVMKAMRADPDMARIPVVVMSSLPESSVSGRVPGYVAFVRKPFRIGTVLDVVAQVLGQSEVAPAVCGAHLGCSPDHAADA
ncbi:MAG: response regulator [Acetobacteraceae bacterium]